MASDGKAKAFLERPIEGDWPYLWIDATYLKVRRGGRIVSVAGIIAVGVNTDGRREVLGLEIGTSEAEPIWTEFLRKLTRRGLRGVKLVISDAHEGTQGGGLQGPQRHLATLPRAFSKECPGTCRQERAAGVSAFIATAFAQDTADAASAQWRAVADQIRPKVPKLATIMDGGGVKRSNQWIDRSRSEHDVLAYSTGPSCTRRMRSTRLP